MALRFTVWYLGLSLVIPHPEVVVHSLQRGVHGVLPRKGTGAPWGRRGERGVKIVMKRLFDDGGKGIVQTDVCMCTRYTAAVVRNLYAGESLAIVTTNRCYTIMYTRHADRTFSRAKEATARQLYKKGPPLTLRFIAKLSWTHFRIEMDSLCYNKQGTRCSYVLQCPPPKTARILHQQVLVPLLLYAPPPQKNQQHPPSRGSPLPLSRTVRGGVA